MDNPFDQFDAKPTLADQLGRPVLVKPTAAIPPTEQYHPMTPAERQALGLGSAVPAVVSGTGKPEVVGGDKTNYRPMSPEEKAANHLSPDAPWLMGSNGDFKLPDGFKPSAVDSNPLEKQQGIDSADALINAVQRARGFIGDADTPIGNTATGLGYNILHHSPIPTDATKLEGVIEQELRGNLFLKRIADLKAASDSPTGGTGIGRIMQAEIPLITGATGTLNPGKFGRDETLKSLTQIERSALRTKATLNGENPDDPQVIQKYGIPALIGAAPPPSSDNPLANGGSGDQGPTLTPSGGGTRAVIDPAKQALGAKIVGLLQKGADRNTVMGFAVGADPTLRADPKFRAWVDQALQYRAKYPKAAFPIDPGFYTTEVPMSLDEKNRNEGAQSPVAAAILNAGDAATLGNAGNIMGDGATNALTVANAKNPNASLLGTMAGGAAVGMGGEGALGAAGMAPGVLRTLLSDFAYGAGASGTHGGNPLTGGAESALGGFLGGKLTSGTGAAVKGVTNPTVSAVAKDVPLTLGQSVSQSGIVGRAVKGVEDRLSGIPVVGDAINARRLEGFQQMNSKAFDRALEPIGAKADGKFGEEAVQHAQDAVHSAFDKALKGKSAAVDTPFITQAASAKRAIAALPPSVAKDVTNHVDAAIKDYFDPKTLTISGENMQGLLRDLQQIKKGYQTDPAGHRIGKAIDQVTASVEGMFQRQAPEVMPAYNAAKQAYKRTSTLESAVLAAKNTEGVFTPAQLGIHDRANTTKFGGKSAAAAGRSDFHDFQRNMQKVLPSKVPDSGTAGRLLIPGALIAAGTGGGALSGDTGEGLTLGALLAAAYSKTGQRALAASVLKRPNAARAAGKAISRAAPMVGHGAAAVAATKRD